MHVLVTGAAGRIGVHLTRALVGEGHTVRAFVLDGDPRASLIFGDNVELCHGRLEDTDSLRAAVLGVDAVYHLAGALTSRGNSDEEFFSLNLRGTYDLLIAVRDHAPKVRRFAYASSDAVYAGGPHHPPPYFPIDEGHPRRPATIYGASKVGAEELCFTFQRAYGIPVTVLRFGATADAEELLTPQSVFARWIFVRSAIDFLASQERLSAPQQETLDILRGCDDGTQVQLVAQTNSAGAPEIVTWGDARDVAQGCLLTLDARQADGEAFNLAGPAPFATTELIRHIADRTGYPFVLAKTPTARTPWQLGSAKARGMLGYNPRRTVFDMVDEVTGFRDGS